MKLIILWLINTIFVLPLKIITILFKLIYKIIKNIYFNNLENISIQWMVMILSISPKHY